MKTSYFIKSKEENQIGNVKPHQHEKIKNTGRTKPNKKKNKLARYELALKHNVFHSKNCLIIGQLNVNRSQPGLEPLNFTVYITSRINVNSSKVSDFHFQIGTLTSKDPAPEQKLLVLFKAPHPQKPPGTNYQQSPS